MVSHPREAAGADRLRPLNAPRPIKVFADANGEPVAIIYKARRITVEGIKDRWRLDDEWWRQEIARMYYQVVLKDGRIFTLFHDLVGGGWFAQSSSLPATRHASLDVFVGHTARRERGLQRQDDTLPLRNVGVLGG